MFTNSTRHPRFPSRDGDRTIDSTRPRLLFKSLPKLIRKCSHDGILAYTQHHLPCQPSVKYLFWVLVTFALVILLCRLSIKMERDNKRRRLDFNPLRSDDRYSNLPNRRLKPDSGRSTPRRGGGSTPHQREFDAGPPEPLVDKADETALDR